MSNVTLKDFDITRWLDVAEDVFPVCPICDSDMEEWELLCTIKSRDSIALAHCACIDNLEEELKNKEDKSYETAD